MRNNLLTHCNMWQPGTYHHRGLHLEWSINQTSCGNNSFPNTIFYGQHSTTTGRDVSLECDRTQYFKRKYTKLPTRDAHIFPLVHIYIYSFLMAQLVGIKDSVGWSLTDSMKFTLNWNVRISAAVLWHLCLSFALMLIYLGTILNL